MISGHLRPADINTRDRDATERYLINQTNFSAKNAASDKLSDESGLYLFVKTSGRYCRMSYRFLVKQKTLALGVALAVSLKTVCEGRDKVRTFLAVKAK
jgi:hypothetical protein